MDKTRAFEAGAVDYITKPFEPLEIQARVRTHVNLRKASIQIQEQNKHLEAEVRRRTAELVRSRMDIIRLLSAAGERKDRETADHVIRVGYYSYVLARALGKDETFCASILLAAPLHDIGKISIPHHILQKSGPLDDEEWSIMKTHTTAGYEILSQSDYSVMKMAATIALTHHEDFDGGGYPNGLVGDGIPLEGQIVALSDMYDALISDRPYKKSWNHGNAVQAIVEKKGGKFSSDLIDTFISVEADFSQLQKQKSIDNLLDEVPMEKI